MPGVVEHIGPSTPTHARHHVGHHGAQAGPGHDLAGVDARETLVHPGDEGSDAVGANVFVVAIEFGGARHAESIHPQAAGHQLGLVIQQAHDGRRRLALCVWQVDGDGIPLHRVDVDPVAQLRGKAAALDAGTNHQPIKLVRDMAVTVSNGDFSLGAIAVQRQNVLPIQALHTQALSRARHARGELVDVARGVALGEIAAVVIASQRGLDGFHFARGHGTAWQAAQGQHLAHFTGVIKALFFAVDMQDALFFEIEIHALRLRPGKQMFTRRNGQASRLHGVALVMRDVANELQHPAQLVPAGLGVDQERCVAFQHPLHALEDGGPVVPHLGIGRGQLTPVGKRGFHGHVAVFLKQRHGKAALGQGISRGDASDAAADHGNGCCG